MFQLINWVEAEEKRAIGAIWASRSNGQCLFVMPTDSDFSELIKVVRQTERP